MANTDYRSGYRPLPISFIDQVNRYANLIGRGVAPQLWTAHPRGSPQNILIRASTGMTRPNLLEVGSGRGWDFSPVGFPTPLLLV